MDTLELKEGSAAPDFTLPGSDKKIHNLSKYRGKKVVLYFYPKDNTPGCTLEAQDFRDNIASFNELNTIVLGVSRDSLISHDKFITKQCLPFTLLSDSDETVCKLYNLLKEKNMYGKKVMGIERSTFIIDEEGFIRRIYRKVKVDNHVNNVLNALREI